MRLLHAGHRHGADRPAGKASAEPEEEAIHDALAGNLCRCTGYRPIVEAAKAAAKTGLQPSEAADLPKWHSEVSFGGSVLHQPATLDELTALRAQYPDATILAGGTDLGVARADYHSDWDRIISTRARQGAARNRGNGRGLDLRRGSHLG
jgi:xanthine dehydrogenase small subunit